jgi:hypothetical protein
MDAVAAAKLDFDNPDESREAKNAKVDIVSTPYGTVARMVLTPGWTWESSIKPIVGTDSCQAKHLGAVISGQIRIIPDDGEPMEYGPGDIYMLMPGHHAEVMGDDNFIAYEFESSTAESYATAGE